MPPIIEYPKLVYREPGGEFAVANSYEEEAALREEWGLGAIEAPPIEGDDEDDAPPQAGAGSAPAFHTRSKLMRLSKDELLEIANTRGLGMDELASKDDLATAILNTQ